MSRRFITILLTPALVCAVAAPALANSAASTRTHVVAQKSAKKGSNVVILSSGLTSGHQYRIEVVSSGKFSVTGNGFENYAYVSNRHVVSGTKPFSLNGRTPLTYVILPPISSKVSQWSLTVQTVITSKHPLTVRFRDLGKTK